MNRSGYVLLLIILICLVLAPVILRPGYLLYPRGGQATDLTITHWPAVAYNIRSLRVDGQVPLWRTTIASGGPWAANPQSWLFYPPAWLFFLLPINLTFNLLLVGHLLLAALATYAFARRALDLSPQGAALAGLAYALAPWVSGHLSAGHVNVVLAVAWLPVALLGVQQSLTTGRAGGALLAGAAWAAALLNHTQIALFIAALTLAWSLLTLSRQGSSEGRKRHFGLLVLVPIVAVSLSAVLLVPLAEALPYLNRTTLTLEEAGLFSLPWTHLLTTVVPTYGGEPEQLVYLGLPIALLAVVGLVLKRDRVSWFLLTLAGMAALFALGTNAPLFPALLRWIPGLAWVRVPPRAWAVVAFSLALLAGRGLDSLSRPHLDAATRRRVALASLVALAAGLGLGAGLLFLFRPPPPAAWSLIAFVVLAVAALLLRTRSWLGPRAFAVALLLLTAADLGLVRAAWTEMRSPDDAFAWGAEAAEYLSQQAGTFRSYSLSYSVPQHTAIQHDLDLADGVDPIQLARYADFLALAGGYESTDYSPTLPPVIDDTSAQPDATRLGLLNVGFVLASFPINVEGLTPAAQLGESYIYRNARVLPRSFVVPGAPDPVQGDIALELPVETRPARIVAFGPNQIIVEADLEARGLLVLSEAWYPGWRALDNGQELPIQRVEGTLRGVMLEPGDHRVEFLYRPWTVWVGLVISGTATLGILAYVAYRVWKRS